MTETIREKFNARGGRVIPGEEFLKQVEDAQSKHAKSEPPPGSKKTATDGAKEKAEDADKWGDPQPIPDGLLPVPTMPMKLVPASFRGWLWDIANRMQVPLEFVAAPAIVSVSSVIGNQIKIRPKRRDDWAVTPNQWGAVIGRPGT